MLEINNVEYELKYPVNTLCLMDSDGINVLKLDSVLENLNMTTMRDLFYYGLKYENKKMTKNQAGELMDQFFNEGGTFNEIAEEEIKALAKALGSSKAKVEDSEEEGK